MVALVNDLPGDEKRECDSVGLHFLVGIGKHYFAVIPSLM